MIESPAVINFSGGRSSGFMLWNILQAYDGKLPEDIRVIFCNTGLEHHETYEFIHRIEENWCPVTWLEYTLTPEGKASYAEVSYASASRRGEPFEMVIKKERYLPNPIRRICTKNLKVLLTERYLKHIGFYDYVHCIGLRADEPKRVSRIREQQDKICPMADAGHIKKDVHDFWKDHPLDMRFKNNTEIFTNCVGCFLKKYSKLEAIAREEPEQLDWWIRMENETGFVFYPNRTDYKTIKQDAHKQMAFDFRDTVDCFCTD